MSLGSHACDLWGPHGRGEALVLPQSEGLCCGNILLRPRLHLLFVLPPHGPLQALPLAFQVHVQT